jgi:hypothetical protein
LGKEKPPVLGMIERGGNVVIRMLENVKQKKVGPLIEFMNVAGTLANTDEYDIYARLKKWNTGTMLSAVVTASMRGMTMVMAFTKCSSI